MYDYKKERENIFTDKGQQEFLIVRDNVKKLLDVAGAFQMIKAWEGITGDTWKMMSYIDRLVELKEIKELENNDCTGQHRVFISY